MSGLAAVWHRDGRPVDRTTLRRLLGGMPDRGAEATTAWIAGTVALGVAAETVCGGLAHDEAAGLHLAFDGRVDNAGDLHAALGDAACEPSSDATLVLRCYERWREAAFARLAGDFAVVIWDATARRLVAARDILGLRPLAFHVTDDTAVVASHAGRLARAAGAPVDERSVAEALSGRVVSLTRTLYSGVTRLRPAHHVVIDGARAADGPYWTPDAVVSHGPRSADAAVEEARVRLDAAVAACARAAAGRPVGLMLSGGLDSGAVYATAAAQGRALRAYTLRSHDTALDETSAARAIVAKAGGRDWIAVDADAAAHDYAAEVAETWELPTYPTGAASHRLRLTAAAGGVRVLLNGVGGDEWFFGSCADLADHLRRGDWRAFARRWREERALPDPVSARALVQSAVWPLVPAGLQRAVRRVAGPARVPPWVGQALHGAMDRPERNWPVTSRDAAEATHHLITDGWSPDAVASREEQARFAARHGVEDRSPWHDRRVVEFALGLPESIRRLDGVPKGLVRRALAGRLPAPTLHGVTYGDHSCHLLEALARVDSRRLVARLTIADRGWVRPRAVQTLQERLDGAVAGGDARWPALAHALWQIVGVELWHRAVAGVDAPPADP